MLRARPFDSEEECLDAVLHHKVEKGDAVFIRYEGPQAAACRRCSTPVRPSARQGAGPQHRPHHGWPLLRCIPRRCHRHVSPEAARRPIGLIEEGDTITIDIPNASITLEVSDAVLAERKAKYVAPEPNIKTGWLSRYARMVTSANLGAVLK